MMHDFALTGKYVVVVDVPITFDMAAAEAGAPVPYVWNAEAPDAGRGDAPSRRRRSRWFETDPVLYSHTLNAYDQGDTVVVDCTTLPAPFYAAGRGNGGPSTTGTPVLEPVDHRPARGPGDAAPGSTTGRRSSPASTSPWCRGGTATATRRAPRRCGAPTRRSTGCRRTTSSPTAWSSTTCCAAPAGAPLPERRGGRRGRCSCHAAAARDEDDGYLLSYVHNPDRGASDLVILSAQDFTARPWPASTCRAGYRSASTGAGSPDA